MSGNLKGAVRAVLPGVAAGQPFGEQVKITLPQGAYTVVSDADVYLWDEADSADGVPKPMGVALQISVGEVGQPSASVWAAAMSVSSATVAFIPEV